MFLKMKGFITKDPVAINVISIIRMNKMKEENGTVILLADGSKVLVMNPLDDILEAIGGVKDLTTEGKEENDGCLDC